MIYSQLMAKVFSDLESDFTNTIASKIDEARANGTASYSDADFDLAFAEVDGDVVIEDKKNNEVTTATTGEDGKTKLECDQKAASATLPDVDSPRSKGEDGKGVETPGSTQPDVDSPISVGITDPDKAGQGKHFSVSFNGFESEDAANEFLNRVLTFSDSELSDVVSAMNDTENLAARVAAYSDVEDALELRDQSDYLRCYANMAQYAGHDVDTILERCEYYSELANDVISDAEMNMSITEYFSEMTEDEVTEFFSELDEEVATALYSALELEQSTEETITFSDINNYLMEQSELNQDITQMFSDMTEDETTEFFSELTDAEALVISTALNSGENITFSELNEELSKLNLPLTQAFSEYSEDDFNEYLSMFSDGELQVIDEMFSAAEDNDNVTYSDYLEALDLYQVQQLMFSDEELKQLADNANELKKAGEDLKADPTNVELAKKVKVLADDMAEDVEKAEEAGHDASAVKKMSVEYSNCASKILDSAHEVKVPADGKKVVNVVKDKELISEVKKTEEGKQEKAFSNPCLTVTAPKFHSKSVTPSEPREESKVFSTTPKRSSNSNPCLTSKF